MLGLWESSHLNAGQFGHLPLAGALPPTNRLPRKTWRRSLHRMPLSSTFGGEASRLSNLSLGRAARSKVAPRVSQAGRSTATNAASWLQRCDVSVINFIRKTGDVNLLHGWVGAEEFHDFLNGNLGGLVNRVAVSAATDGGKGEGLDVVDHGQFQRLDIAGSQQFRFVMPTAPPNRPHRVNDMLGRQFVAACDLGLARLASIQRPAFLRQFGAGRPVNRSVHPAPAEQGRVGRVDNRIDGQLDDVGAGEFDLVHDRFNFDAPRRQFLGALLNELGQDADRDFRDAVRLNIQTHRASDLRHLFRAGNFFFHKLGEDPSALCAGCRSFLERQKGR